MNCLPSNKTLYIQLYYLLCDKCPSKFYTDIIQIEFFLGFVKGRK